jgi:hypothetical protein
MFLWRYNVSNIQLIIPEVNIITIPPERLVSISILNDYESYVYPIFKIELVLEPSIYYKILKYKDKIQFHLRIQKYYQRIDSKSTSLKRDFINDTFTLILDDESLDLTDVTKRQLNKYDFKYIRKNDLNDVREANNKVEFFLFKTDNIRGLNTTPVNAILKDCTITDALAYVLTTAKIRNVLMSPAHNNVIYKNIVIPPLSCLHALRFLDTYYGIYKTGSMMFFDFNTSYILQYDGKCTAYQQNEIQNTQIVIPSESNGHATQCCTISKDSDLTANYIVADYRSISIYDDTITNDIISDSNVKYIDNYTGDVELSISRKSIDDGSYKFQENKTENQWLGQIYTAQSASAGTVVSLLLMDYDVDMLSPNKKMNLVFEDSALSSKYNGVYMLTNVNHKFTKEGSNFIISTMINLKRTK